MGELMGAAGIWAPQFKPSSRSIVMVKDLTLLTPESKMGWSWSLLNVGLGSVGSYVIQQQLDEEASLLWVGHPHDAAAISGGLVVAADGEAVPNMKHLQCTSPGLLAGHSGFQTSL